jgi:hypothetical protein
MVMEGAALSREFIAHEYAPTEISNKGGYHEKAMVFECSSYTHHSVTSIYSRLPAH